jgi:hypothetical protein
MTEGDFIKASNEEWFYRMSEIRTLALLMRRSLISAASLAFCSITDSDQRSRLYWPAASSPAKHLQKITDSFVLQHLIAEAQIRIDPISQPSAFSYLGNVAVSFKVSDYPVYCLLGDAYRQRKLSNSNPRLLSDLAKHQSMVGNKLPSRHNYTACSKLGPITPQKFFLQNFSAKAKTS